ncbi:O-antigen ligase family protein [Lysobacter sp. F6437]|uniref:O-antigen ligase family protein n=1 Tax=Lysobacter sp. F6437 TaxID=3459296 RepID=UPI00403E33B4
MRPPDPAAAKPGPRFPLAARVLRSPVALQPARRGDQPAHAPTMPATAATAPRRLTLGSPKLWPLYLFVFLLPLQNLQTGHMPNLGGGLNFLNVMFMLALAGCLLARGRLAPHEPVNAWVFVYAAYMVVSLFIGYQYVSGTEAHMNTLKDHLLGVFVVYLVQMGVSDWAGVRRIVIATVLPLPYILKVVWAQHNSVSSWGYDDDMRISGTFSLLGANEFAAFCTTTAVSLFALLLATRLSKAWKLALVAGVGCMVLGVLYAYSRTAYVSLILGLVTVILAWRGRWKMMLPLLLAVAVVPGLLPYSVVERFESTTVEAEERDESTDMRFVYWGIAIETFGRHPVVGTGFHTFHHSEINPYNKDTHNLYLRTLSEGGIIGGVILLGLLLSLLHAGLRSMARAPTGSWHYALALGLVGTWTALICSNLFGDRFTYYPVVAYFWAYVALVLKARHLPPEGTAR